MNGLSDGAVKLNKTKAGSVFGDYLIMLAAPCFVAVRFYGLRSLLIVAASVAAAVVTDALGGFVINRKADVRDLCSVFTGAAIALMMPAGVPVYIPVFASVFAVAVAKFPFGSSGKLPFVPAAAGFAFASVCFKEHVFSYAYGTADKLFGAESLGAMLLKGSAVRVGTSNVFDFLVGNVAGPMGTGCIVLMLACVAYLLVRRPGALLASVGMVASCAVMIFIFPRAEASFITNLVCELCSGSLMFAAVFLITDEATLPKKKLNKVVYGAVCGILCMGMRYMGAYEETVCFAVLLANAMRPVFDSAIGNMPKKHPRKGGEAA